MRDGISIPIPTYDGYGGNAVAFLKHSLEIISQQTYRNIEVVISDDSDTTSIYHVCTQFPNLDIKYYKSEDIQLEDRPYKKGMTPNLNRAMRKCTRSIIKILFQDDFLNNERSLHKTYSKFKEAKSKWLASSLTHTDCDGIIRFKPQIPSYHDGIHFGINTLSSPSIISIINEDNILLFDEELVMLMDCEYYKRLAMKYGQPTILGPTTVVIRQHSHQISSTAGIDQNLMTREKQYVERKYAKHT